MIAVVVMGIIIFQSREGSTSFNKLKITVLTFLVKKSTSFPGCLFGENTRKTLKLNLCSCNRPRRGGR